MGAIESATLIGSGIAGPVLAMFLARAGITATLVEARSETGTDEGAFLGVAPNGMHVLHVLGVGESVEAAGFRCDGFGFRNAKGERIGLIDRRGDALRHGASLIMIRRADLHRVLVDATRARGVEVRFGRRLVSLAQEPGGVRLTFEGGVEERAEVVLGCDGIRSATRAAALPDAPGPEFTGLLDIAGYASYPDAPLDVGWNEMVFGRRAFFGAFKTGTGEVWWFHNRGVAEEPGALATSVAALRDRVLALHADDPAFISEIVRRSEVVLGPYPLHDILMLPRWHRGRICVLGDAAHATTPSAGQGASLAIEDGMALARCLRDAATPESAFAAFERARRGRVEEIVRESRRMGGTKAPSGPVGAWFRDRLLPVFLRAGARGQERAYAYRESFEPSMAPGAL